MDIEVGKLAISKSGHDKNNIYVVMEVIEGFVILSDGKLKTIDKPKKKNIKHIQIIDYKSDEVIEKILNGKIIDEEIKRCIKLFKKEHPCNAYK